MVVLVLIVPVRLIHRIKYELSCRQTCFIDSCLNSVNSVVGCSAQFCSALFEVNLRGLGCVTRRLAWQLYNRDMYC